MQEMFNKDIEELKNKHQQLTMNNRITDIKNTLEGANNRVIEAEECISELEDRMMKITEAEHTHTKKL